MSLFSALTVAVGGLNAQSNSIGNISDNISNASTTGFKRIDTEFQSLVTQSSLTLNDPGGVRATPVYQNNIQGNLAQSQSTLSLAISGNGFFNVKLPATAANGSTVFNGEELFTRRGDFTLDKEGYMVNGAGYALIAHPINTTTNTVDPSLTTQVQISAAQDNPVATSTVSYSANLPASATTSSTFAPSNVQIYDSLGKKHDLTFSWAKLSAANTWRLTITPADATVGTGGPAIGAQTLDFNFQNSSPAGTINPTNGIINTGSGTFFTINTPTTSGSPATVTFPATFAGAGNSSITLNFGQYGKASGVTQFDATDLNVSSIEQNGVPQGSFKDISIDANGLISINYDNGRSRTLYQIPVTTFNSPNSLQRKDGGVFAKTTESGTANRHLPNNNGAGKIVGSTLEGSNVDIADEFTKMITAQRIYSANARTITTTNSMLEEVINIIR